MFTKRRPSLVPPSATLLLAACTTFACGQQQHQGPEGPSMLALEDGWKETAHPVRTSDRAHSATAASARGA
jgi:outer membrane biogenesis lipoprotein LolB